jgi:hypothetical protein
VHDCNVIRTAPFQQFSKWLKPRFKRVYFQDFADEEGEGGD